VALDRGVSVQTLEFVAATAFWRSKVGMGFADARVQFDDHEGSKGLRGILIEGLGAAVRRPVGLLDATVPGGRLGRGKVRGMDWNPFGEAAAMPAPRSRSCRDGDDDRGYRARFRATPGGHR